MTDVVEKKLKQGVGTGSSREGFAVLKGRPGRPLEKVTFEQRYEGIKRASDVDSQGKNVRQDQQVQGP